jgi:hypothetical protein
LNVTHTDKEGKTYANIATATPIPKGMQAEFKQQNPTIYLDLNNPDPDDIRLLPEWLQKIVAARLPDPETPAPPPTQEQVAEAATVGDFNDDIPF